MENPKSEVGALTTVELFSRILKHYSQTRIVRYKSLASAYQVELENEVLALEKIVFERERQSQFARIRSLCCSNCATDRLAAVMILYRGETSGGEIPDLLLSRLECESDNEVLSQLVLWFRYHHEDDRAIPGVCSLYGHPDHMVRTCVADVLGAYRDDQRATEVLTKLLLDVNPNVRAVAEEELAALN